ncbi:MAG: thioredoxin family protein [Candidatus Kapaibacterium sp.]
MALLSSNSGNLGSPVIDFNLRGTEGKYCCTGDFQSSRVLVIIFMCNHCPYVKAVIDRFVRLQAKYINEGVQFIGINPNDSVFYPEDSFENMINFVKERKINFPYLADDTQQTARAFDAVCTPDIYVYDSNRMLKYRGRLDDNWKEEDKVTRHDLDDAIKLLLNGEEISKEQIPSMGCSIKWKK